MPRPSVLGDARDSLLASTRGWLRYQWGEAMPTSIISLSEGIIGVFGIVLATPFALFFGWFVRRRARRECDAEGVEWRK